MFDKIKDLKKLRDCSMPSNEKERIHNAETKAYNQAIDDVVKILQKDDAVTWFRLSQDSKGNISKDIQGAPSKLIDLLDDSMESDLIHNIIATSLKQVDKFRKNLKVKLSFFKINVSEMLEFQHSLDDEDWQLIYDNFKTEALRYSEEYVANNPMEKIIKQWAEDFFAENHESTHHVWLKDNNQ